jgi:hypothetical protein
MKAQNRNRIVVALIACSVAPLLHADPAADVQALAARSDCEAAQRAWRDWAQKGNAEAQYFIASLYFNGQGVAQDYEEGVRWVRQAAEQGHAAAQYNLSIAYLAGRGLAKDEAEYVHWTRKAAEQGYAPAQHNLASFVLNGRLGVTKDEAEGVRLFQKAAEQGWVPSQRALVAIYLQGQGAAKDYVEAYKWATIAAAGTLGPDAQATINGRDSFAKSMTRTQVEQASQLAREWKETGTAIYSDSRFARVEKLSEVTAGQSVNARAYSVTAPGGSAWNVEVDRYNDVVTFSKGRATNAADLGRIAVVRRDVGLAAAARDEVDLVTAIECSEEANLKRAGKAKSYTLGEVSKEIVTFDGKTLYVMSYVITDRRLSMVVDAKSVAYTYLPSNWKESRRAYSFVLEQPQKIGDATIAIDSAEIQSVISGLREK